MTKNLEVSIRAVEPEHMDEATQKLNRGKGTAFLAAALNSDVIWNTLVRIRQGHPPKPATEWVHTTVEFDDWGEAANKMNEMADNGWETVGVSGKPRSSRDGVPTIYVTMKRRRSVGAAEGVTF